MWYYVLHKTCAGVNISPMGQPLKKVYIFKLLVKKLHNRIKKKTGSKIPVREKNILALGFKVFLEG